MKLRFALAGLVAMASVAAQPGTASAMPLSLLENSLVASGENVAVVCGPRGCIRTAPVYRGYRGYAVRPYGVRRYGYGVRRGYGYHRGYRRW